MIIAIKGVTDLYARASLKQLKCPTLEIRRKTNDGKSLEYDWIISAPQDFYIVYEEGLYVDEQKAVTIGVYYHGHITQAYMSKGSYEYIVTYEGDIFTRKDKENV